MARRKSSKAAKKAEPEQTTSAEAMPLPPVNSPSPLLARLSNFLPEMAAANKALEETIAAEGAAAVSIEAVPEGERAVEMEVGLGVCDGSGVKERADIPTVDVETKEEVKEDEPKLESLALPGDKKKPMVQVLE
eukprot:TRINITY_DN5218_c0_g1_i1.p3 TRINITY_DN5218_c0_g1~~TRINITY_DN5218_c0_g1_i1.p3  ORF type:complete len:134 (-),score=39.21 TRINITY_DN5218_c0_g1_i1:654-1055(-)